MIRVLKLSEKEEFKTYVSEDIIKRLEISRDFFLPLGEKRYFMVFKYFSEGEVIIYADVNDFVLYSDCKEILQAVERIEITENGILQLHEFFLQLTADDVYQLQAFEKRIIDLEDSLLINNNPDRKTMFKIVSVRKDLLRIKRYYVQMEFLTDEIAAIDPAFNFIDKKFDRLLDFVLHLQEYIEQVREAYQSQIDIEQNNIMKVFTVVTSVFLPLTLIVGWYGMNLQMPEYKWIYGYPMVIATSAIVVLALVIIFKRKKWF